MSMEDPGGDRLDYAEKWGEPQANTLENLRAWLAREKVEGQRRVHIEDVQAGLKDMVKGEGTPEALDQIKKLWESGKTVAEPIFPGANWPYSQSTKPSVGWSCPNCGRCFAPHINSCTNCVGTYQWPYGVQPVPSWPRWPVQPSPWWQVPPTSPWTYGTVTVPTTAASGGSGPTSGTYDHKDYQTRLDG